MWFRRMSGVRPMSSVMLRTIVIAGLPPSAARGGPDGPHRAASSLSGSQMDLASSADLSE